MANWQKYKLDIYDISGDKKYNKVARYLYSNVRGIILMYNVCDRNTFNNLENYLENIVNRPELKINNSNKNENKNINIDDSTIGKRRNYHMTKSQSQMLPPKTNNNINKKEEQNENKIVQNLEQDNNDIKKRNCKSSF